MQGDFAERVWDETLNLRAETSLERLERFKQFRSVWFRTGFAVYILAMVSGLLAISSKSSGRGMASLANLFLVTRISSHRIHHNPRASILALTVELGFCTPFFSREESPPKNLRSLYFWVALAPWPVARLLDGDYRLF